MLENVWVSKQISIKIKICIVNPIVKSVLHHGFKTWRTTKTMMQKIQKLFNTCLRSIYNIIWPDKIRNEDPQDTRSQHHTPSPDLEPA
jgi:hypothetical protein